MPGEHALFVLAHQDDEYAAAPWIVDERSVGSRVSCLSLTDGASRADVAIRDAESRAVLASLGVDARDVVMLDDGERIRDHCCPVKSLAISENPKYLQGLAAFFVSI